ncbi:MAG TPA: hypothetical protein VJY37_02510, partial [Anaerovoracaceae bacterium]|nr:hypothetical protein [Anaerovoracaceae bacterium]
RQIQAFAHGHFQGIGTMQMTNMNSVDDLKMTQKALNEQLIEALLKEQERIKDKDKEDDK